MGFALGTNIVRSITNLRIERCYTPPYSYHRGEGPILAGTFFVRLARSHFDETLRAFFLAPDGFIFEGREEDFENL